ncbi:MAG: hypothetical protein IIB54_04160 [Planctomycetes bacterium]|nr:hypothetical protein [Planctomycetota bacterium]
MSEHVIRPSPSRPGDDSRPKHIPHHRLPDTPRRVRDGIKIRILKEGRAPAALTTRWIECIRLLVGEEERIKGLEYARAGQIASYEQSGGRIRTRVQDRAARPYQTDIDVPELSETKWDEMIERMSKKALFVARMLSAKTSDDLHDVFQSEEVELVPGEPMAFHLECNCQSEEPCWHMAAVMYILADRLEAEPLLIFSLRGLPAEQLLDRLRHAREIREHGVAVAHADPMIPETQIPPQPLDECLDDFWRAGKELSDLEHAAPIEHLPHALLRRLGPTPLPGRFPMVGLLASIYDSVSKYARDLRDRAEVNDRRSPDAPDVEHPVDDNAEAVSPD